MPGRTDDINKGGKTRSRVLYVRHIPRSGVVKDETLNGM